MVAILATLRHAGAGPTSLAAMGTREDTAVSGPLLAQKCISRSVCGSKARLHVQQSVALANGLLGCEHGKCTAKFLQIAAATVSLLAKLLELLPDARHCPRVHASSSSVPCKFACGIEPLLAACLESSSPCACLGRGPTSVSRCLGPRPPS